MGSETKTPRDKETNRETKTEIGGKRVREKKLRMKKSEIDRKTDRKRERQRERGRDR